MVDTRGRGILAKPDEMTERQERVAALRLHGFTQEAIGRELGVSQSTIRDELKRIREIWKNRAAQSYEAHVAQAVARLDQIGEALAPKLHTVAGIDMAIKLEDRRARLLGIDRPVEQKVTITIEGIDAEIARLEAKANEDENGLEILEGEIVSESVD